MTAVGNISGINATTLAFVAAILSASFSGREPSEDIKIRRKFWVGGGKPSSGISNSHCRSSGYAYAY